MDTADLSFLVELNHAVGGLAPDLMCYLAMGHLRHGFLLSTGTTGSRTNEFRSGAPRSQ